MTAKEKAEELLKKSYYAGGRVYTNNNKIALLCVDEILELQLELAHDDNVNNIADFYKQVKQEINKL